MPFRLLHPENAALPMEVRLLGRVTLVRPLHPENAELPMEVMLLGRVTLVRPLQLPNALCPMEVMLLGRDTLVRSLFPRNAWSPIPVTGRLLMVDGMIKLPEAFGLEPVMVRVLFPLFWYNNAADREVEEKRRRERMQAEKFLRKAIVFIFLLQWGGRDVNSFLE